MKDTICTSIGIIGGAIASLFGGWDTAPADAGHLYGHRSSPVWWWRACSTPAPRPRPVRWKARLAGRASSAKGETLLIVLVACQLMPSSAAASSATQRSSAFSANEAISIVENLMGLPIPAAITKAIDISSSGPRRPRKARTDMKKKISAGTLTRTAVLGLALTNQLLSAAAKPLLPIDNAQLEQMISECRVYRRLAALAAWWN